MKLEFITVTGDSLLNYIRTKHEIQGCPVFRFFTIIDYGEELRNIVPFQDTIRYLSDSYRVDDGSMLYQNFVSNYTNQILTFNPSFIDFMKVLSVLQEAPEVIVMTDYNHPLVMPIVETLISIIQERYSLNTFLVNDIDDIDLLSFSDFGSDAGYLNYIQDVERYLSHVGIPLLSAGETWDYGCPDSQGGGENVI